MSDEPIRFQYGGHEWEIDFGLNTSYSNAIRKMNPHIQEWYIVEEDEHTGEWFAIGRVFSGDSWENYYHKGTFGSCSGCDWLQSIRTEEEAVEFLDEMKKLVRIPGDGRNHEVVAFIEREQANLWGDAKNALEVLRLRFAGVAIRHWGMVEL